MTQKSLTLLPSKLPDELRSSREKDPLKAKITALKQQPYDTTIHEWIQTFPAVKDAIQVVNDWLEANRTRLISDYLEPAIKLWLPRSESQGVWPADPGAIDLTRLCKRKFVDHAQTNQPSFTQRGRKLCGVDGRYLALVSVSALGSIADDPAHPSSRPEDFILIFDVIHQMMGEIKQRQIEIIKNMGNRKSSTPTSAPPREKEAPVVLVPRSESSTLGDEKRTLLNTILNTYFKDSKAKSSDLEKLIQLREYITEWIEYRSKREVTPVTDLSQPTSAPAPDPEPFAKAAIWPISFFDKDLSEHVSGTNTVEIDTSTLQGELHPDPARLDELLDLAWLTDMPKANVSRQARSSLTQDLLSLRIFLEGEFKKLKSNKSD